jgi:filamentous hemagglutinin
VHITQEFGREASKAVASYTQTRRQQLREQLTKASGADKVSVQAQLDQVNNEERVLNILVGAVTGFGASALTKESLAAAADEMRSLMVKDSTTFAGVVDSTGKVLSNNAKSLSAGINGDGVKLGGTRVDLDALCGLDNSRCEIPKKPDGTADTTKPIVFTGGRSDDGTPKQSLAEFLATPQGQKMAGPTGGVQGAGGTLFGRAYDAGSWQDKLIESFAGTHDMIGGKLSGLYDEQGNIKRGMSDAEVAVYNKLVTTTAILPSMPFAAAQGLPPEVWKAIGVLLKAAK